MTLTDRLTEYVHAAFTGLWVQTHEPDEAEREILRHAREAKWTIAVWDIANGLRVTATAAGNRPGTGANDPLVALRALPALADSDGTALLLMHNLHRFLTNPEVIQTAFAQLIAGRSAGPATSSQMSTDAGSLIYRRSAVPFSGRSTAVAPPWPLSSSGWRPTGSPDSSRRHKSASLTLQFH